MEEKNEQIRKEKEEIQRVQKESEQLAGETNLF
jgi:hypothetical protein